MKYNGQDLVNFNGVIDLAELAAAQGQEGVDALQMMSFNDDLSDDAQFLAYQAFHLARDRNGESND